MGPWIGLDRSLRHILHNLTMTKFRASLMLVVLIMIYSSESIFSQSSPRLNARSSVLGAVLLTRRATLTNSEPLTLTLKVHLKSGPKSLYTIHPKDLRLLQSVGQLV